VKFHNHQSPEGETLEYEWLVVESFMERFLDIMATLDQDVQAATIVINDLVTALAAATAGESGVSAADQTALETAIVAGNTALAPTGTTTTVPTNSGSGIPPLATS
jgi:hypothetical protein